MSKLTHLALFWLKNPASPEHGAAQVEGLETLRGIEQVKTMEIGFPADTSDRDVVDGTWSVSLLMTFDNLADEALYQTHPVHLAFIARCEHLWDRVLVYDLAASA
jgi:hypothetical protein